jgi:hypothetical protein
MSDEKNSGVDPRFDPAFQRGFDPSVPIEEYVPPPLPRTPARAPVATAAKAPVATAATVPVAPAATLQVKPIDPEVVVESDLASDPADADEREVEADTETSPSRNPFLLLLGIIAVALVAAGIWLFVRSGGAFNSAEVRSQGDYMSLDATIHTAPFIALLGAATAIGVLFVFAAKYQRHR